MANEVRTLLHTIEGPKGKVEVYEVEDPSSGSFDTRYEVITGGETRDRVRAMGHAYIVAEELAGVSS
jgi:hypothetical protein